MTVRSLIDFPQAREAPEYVRRGLRALDPQADVVYLGPMQWVVGRVRPNVHTRRIAVNLMDNAMRKLSEGARMTPRGRIKVRFALLALQGFRPVQEYRLRDLDGRVVKDFAESQWRMLNTSDAEFFRQLDAASDEARESAAHQMADLDRAKDAHRFLTTSSFGYAVSSVARPERLSSARTRHALPS